MTQQQPAIDVQSLFQHWMQDITTNHRYTDLTSFEIQKMTQNASSFLSNCVTATRDLAAIDPNTVRPLLDFLRTLRSNHTEQGLTIRDTTLMILSLKSSLTDYTQANSMDAATTHHLHHLLDILGMVAFEWYTQERESLIDPTAPIHLNDPASGPAFGTLIGRSDAMAFVYQAIGLVLENDVSVLLQGETGTGKDVIATTIHRHSPRNGHPFVAVNCGAIPDNLIESELFGHERGAFTGADDRRLGVFEQAQNGTVFLDEISELPLNQQRRLLRVLQNNQVQRLGGTQTTPINVRIIAASNRPLDALVKTNEFRSDLFYRLNVFPIYIPRLAERGNDVILLTHHFIKKYSHQFKISPPKITASAQQYLLNHTWPGNIRELENIIQRAIIISQGTIIDDTILRYIPGQMPSLLQLPPPPSSSPPFNPVSLDEHEAIVIRKTLRYYDGNIKKAAETLNISRTTLYNKCKKYAINPNQSP